MEPLATLLDRSDTLARTTVPGRLREIYGGDLSFPEAPDRPYVVANFVSTMDGVVSYGVAGKSGGGHVSGFNRQDAFVMGLLRAYADAVMVGAGTLHGDPGHVRIAPFIFPEAEHMFADLRRGLAKPTLHPLNVIVSGSGRVDLSEPTFHTPGLETLILTGRPGRARLEADHRAALTGTQVHMVGEGPTLPVRAILRSLYEDVGVRLLLHEGGPTLFGRFLEEGLVDELFLTVAPRIAGRSAESPRRSLVEGVAFPLGQASDFKLVSLKRAGEHLFQRWKRPP